MNLKVVSAFTPDMKAHRVTDEAAKTFGKLTIPRCVERSEALTLVVLICIKDIYRTG